MELEKLTKTQIVLLTLFVSFVTSIATGIVTVTLLDQAPPGITQTINRVVERTVEKVLPGETKVKEVRVVVPEDDAVVSAVKAAQPALARGFDAQAFLVDASGLYLTALGNYEVGTGEYTLTLSDGKSAPVDVLLADAGSSVAVLKLRDAKVIAKVVPLTLSPDLPQAGQTVVAVGGEVARGLVSSVLSGNASSTPMIKTTLGKVVPGTPILDTRGNVMAMMGDED